MDDAFLADLSIEHLMKRQEEEGSPGQTPTNFTPTGVGGGAGFMRGPCVDLLWGPVLSVKPPKKQKLRAITQPRKTSPTTFAPSLGTSREVQVVRL